MPSRDKALVYSMPEYHVVHLPLVIGRTFQVTNLSDGKVKVMTDGRELGLLDGPRQAVKVEFVAVTSDAMGHWRIVRDWTTHLYTAAACAAAFLVGLAAALW
jgi:hypothetical protein